MVSQIAKETERFGLRALKCDSQPKSLLSVSRRQTYNNLPGACNCTPGDAKCVTEILGDKNEEVWGTKFKMC